MDLREPLVYNHGVDTVENVGDIEDLIIGLNSFVGDKVEVEVIEEILQDLDIYE